MSRGSVKEFDANWRGRSETAINFWRRGKALNQIELAFGQHYSFMREEIGIPKSGKVLDAGAGRGSFAEYFVDDGYETTLLDSSEVALASAQSLFAQRKHKAEFVVGDVLRIPFEDASFDVVVSIGLLEHFTDVSKAIDEQLRVLASGGMFVAYVIPKRTDNVQQLFAPLNDLLAKSSWLFNPAHAASAKSKVYRNAFDASHYEKYLKKTRRVVKIDSRGVYPLPEISYSFQFPFSFLPPVFEKVIVAVKNNVLRWRADTYEGHPWGCDEKLGQGFMVWGQKR